MLERKSQLKRRGLLACVLAIGIAAGVPSMVRTADREKGDSKARSEASGVSNERTSDDWSIFRGTPQGDGVASGRLAEKPEVIWKKSYPDGGFEATAVIVDSTVYVGSLDGNLYALDLATGDEKWKFFTELGFRAPAAVRDGTVYIGDTDGIFYAIDAKTGVENWRFQTNAEISAGANFYQDKVLLTSQDGSLYCLDTVSHSPVWKYTTGDMIQCAPSVVENRCFLAGCDSMLHVVDLDQGTAAGTLKISSQTNSTPAVSGDLVYFGLQDGKLLCVNWREVKEQWAFSPEKGKKPIQSSPAVAQGVVVFGGQDRTVRGLDSQTGNELWTLRGRANFDGSPVIVGKRVFIGGGDGRVYALMLATGEKQWEFEGGGGFRASPAVAHGRLVIGNDAGDLYCFGAP